MDGVIKICPSSELLFPTPLTDGTHSEVSVHLLNLCDDKLVYKIKTNNLQSFEVKNHIGLIGPQEKTVVTAQLKPGRVCQQEDKLLILTSRVPLATTVDDIGQWLADNQDGVTYNVLCCKCQIESLLTPSQSSFSQKKDGYNSNEDHPLKPSMSKKNLKPIIKSKSNVSQNWIAKDDMQKSISLGNISEIRKTKSYIVCNEDINISPRNELKFSSTSRIANIYIENNSDDTVAYKLRTTNTKSYVVFAPRGFIEPGQTAEIAIHLKFDEIAKQRDKFVVLIVKAKKTKENEELDTLFKSLGTDSNGQFMFECLWFSSCQDVSSFGEVSLDEKDFQISSLRSHVENLKKINKKATGQIVLLKCLVGGMLSILPLVAFLIFYPRSLDAILSDLVDTTNKIFEDFQ